MSQKAFQKKSSASLMQIEYSYTSMPQVASATAFAALARTHLSKGWSSTGEDGSKPWRNCAAKRAAFQSFVTSFLPRPSTSSLNITSVPRRLEQAQYLSSSAEYLSRAASGSPATLPLLLDIFSRFGFRACPLIITWRQGI